MTSCEIDGSCCGPDSDCCIQGATFRKGSDRDLEQITALLRDNKLPIAGVAANIHAFVVAEKKQRIIGTAAIERYGHFGLLRSVAITAAFKGQGLGASLVDKILEHGKASGIEEVFLLTTTAENYFPRFGFERISRDDVPEALNQSEEFRGACPDSAIVMRLKL